jgi:hypothetical protein
MLIIRLFKEKLKWATNPVSMESTKCKLIELIIPSEKRVFCAQLAVLLKLAIPAHFAG